MHSEDEDEPERSLQIGMKDPSVAIKKPTSTIDTQSPAVEDGEEKGKEEQQEQEDLNPTEEENKTIDGHVVQQKRDDIRDKYPYRLTRKKRMGTQEEYDILAVHVGIKNNLLMIYSL